MAFRIKKHSAIKTQCFVLKAMFRRELVTRFGKYKMGALWMIIDPLTAVIIMGLVLGPFLGRSAGDIPYAFFLLCGFMLLNLLTGPMSSGAGAIKSNQGLLVFKKVQPFDAFLSRFVFDFVTTTIAFVLFCLVGAWFGIPISFGNIFALFYCLLLTWLIGCGLGLILGIQSLKTPELEKIVGYTRRPLIFLSAVLYPIMVIPPDIRKYLLWNPLVHTIEYSRICLFPSYDAPHINLLYPTGFALCCLALGMMTYRNNRSYLTQR